MTSKDVVKEFNRFVGDSPMTLAGSETCFVCGQPTDKSPQIAEMKAWLLTALRRAMESVVVEEKTEEEVFLPRNMNKGDMVGLDNVEWNAARAQMLGNIKKFFV